MKKIRLKNKKKKKLNIKVFKFLFFLILFSSSILFTIKYFIDKSDLITTDDYVNYLINKSYNKTTDNFIIKESIKLISNIDLKEPSTLIDNKFKKAEIKEKDAKASDDDYKEDTFKKITTYVESQNQKQDKPVVYIYNSHQLETYSNKGLESNNITPNVMMSSYLLSEELNKNGIPSIFENTNISEFIKVSNLQADSFYASTRIFLKNVINKYDTLKYFIDIHRDSVSRDVSYTDIDGKGYARILFVLGTTNKNYKENEKIMLSLDTLCDKYYPNLSRGIYKRETPSWPDSYNQDINSGVILIEIGATDNTFDEVSNTINALAKIIKIYINGEKDEN